MTKGVLRTTLLAIVVLAAATPLLQAQSTGSSLRGTVTDEQGGALPGATVTATSPDMIRPATTVTDNEGHYRLINLPPGEYTITVELSGFSVFKRDGILLRAAVNFQVDVNMKLGGLSETITVSGESPMLEVSKPGNVLNIDGEFQKNLPLAARKNWTDFLEQTPGVHSRPFDDGSGRMVYFGHATEHFAHVVQLEGMQAGNYNDFQLTYVQMGSDMIQDIQVKTGGSDAATPMGTGLGINVITKSGGNSFRGSAGFAYQPLDWASDNTHHKTMYKPAPPLSNYVLCPNGECVSTGGTPVQADVKQFDGSFGGPIRARPDLVLRLVPAVPSRNLDQPHREGQERHPVVLPGQRAVSPADQGLSALRQDHEPAGQRPRVVGVLATGPDTRPEQLVLLLRSHQPVLQRWERVQRQAHLVVELQADDHLLGGLQRQAGQRRGHLQGVRIRGGRTEHRGLPGNQHRGRAHHAGTT